MKALLLTLFGLFVIFEGNASESIGSYSKGSLKNADSILDKSVSIHKLFLARKKFYTSDSMHEVIRDGAEYLRQEFPDVEVLQIGDLSALRGGSAPGHSSHQNGLDMDVVYLTHNKRLQSPEAAYWEEDFIVDGKISPNFHHQRNFAFFYFLVHHHPVQRIFVDAVIKKEMCLYSKQAGIWNDLKVQETLRRLRVLDLHRTHFHVRIRCPETNSSCVSQEEVPKGHGCSF